MSVIHFLNVLEGDCNIIQHDLGGRVTVIDVSNAYNDVDTAAEKAVKASYERQVMLKANNYVPTNKTNYRQKESPDNPIDYLNKLKVNEIWRFIVTHPDMDHLDGIKDLYSEFAITHTWDTNNNKEFAPSDKFVKYNREDWDFYKNIRDGKYTGTKRLTPHAGDEENYWKDDDIKILCPTPGLVKNANATGDYNDASYALLFTPLKKDGTRWKILFAGDTHDDSWDYILKNHKDEVANIDILFAPHHGRDSSRKYDFLDVLKPRMTLFGNASSDHLAYNKYPPIRITNNQAGYVVVKCLAYGLYIYVKNQEFMKDFRAKRKWDASTYSSTYDGYHLVTLK